MKRILTSIAGAVIILLLLAGGFLLGAYVGAELHGPRWIAGCFFIILAWPLLIFDSIFGTYQSALSDHEPTLPALFCTLITQLLIFSTSIYMTLRWRANNIRLK